MFVCQHPGIVGADMRKVFLPVLLASALALAALCAPALAQSDSAIDEYQESIPGSGGGPSSSEGGQGGAGGSGGGSESGTGPVGGGGASLAPSVADELADEGSAGAALGDFTEKTGTAPASKASSTGGGDGGSSSTGPASTGSDDEGFFGALGNVLGNFLVGSGDSDSGSSGLGVFFPIVLIGALAGTAALLIARRRRGPVEPHQG
jgi:hypothetical protein